MKNRGFILKKTLFLIFILLSISSLVTKAVKSRAGKETLEKNNRERDSFLEAVQEMALYELYLLDNYVKNGELESIEEYFYKDNGRESILDDYYAFTTDRERNRESMGGYYITYINPDPRGIYIPQNYQFSIMLSKEIQLSGESGDLVKAVMRTGYVRVRCELNPFEETITCGNLGKIEELVILGEEIDEERGKESGEEG